jgi:hypothetical protein
MWTKRVPCGPDLLLPAHAGRLVCSKAWKQQRQSAPLKSGFNCLEFTINAAAAIALPFQAVVELSVAHAMIIIILSQ